jgi:hypothetical protein
MEHQEFLPRAVAWFGGRRRRGLPKGVRQTSAARGGAKERPAPSRPRRVGRRHDGAGAPTNTCVTLKMAGAPRTVAPLRHDDPRRQRRSSLFPGGGGRSLFRSASFCVAISFFELTERAGVHGNPGGRDPFLDAATLACAIVGFRKIGVRCSCESAAPLGSRYPDESGFFSESRNLKGHGGV